MGVFSGTIRSSVLHMDTTIGVILPQDVKLWEKCYTGKKPKTLILLHGLTDNWAAWLNRSRIANYAERHGVAVVMPEVQRSFYQDMVYGEAYFRFVSDELPRVTAELFNVSIAPDDLMVAGLSMGGYGALRCGLTHPDRYRAIGAFSSACWIEPLLTQTPAEQDQGGLAPVVMGMFGDPPRVPDEAKLELLAFRARGTSMPIMMTCGTEDPLYSGNEDMFEQLRRCGLNVDFETWNGAHEWDFWDKSIAMFLDRFA